ncbi:hypothetical protein B0A50_01068 [Salinomyces thailandicus]|uniref:Myotubularin phosphatase domain-containing protein n=1 Tax=Salinomyces thailandicus TaxID=706561 RepID=A0A4U0UDH8_9PEZI|nr:hypothetical protein B0A50_01068 [Salinomyces thailandica]
MVDTNARDLRVQHVRLWRRKKAVSGTLTMTESHLKFTYSLDERHGEAGGASETKDARRPLSVSTEGSTLHEGSANLRDARDVAGGAGSQHRQSRHKSQTKTMFIAYPMISRCVLRPSYLQGATLRTTMPSDSETPRDSHDSFPPTYGSADFTRPSTDSVQPTQSSTPRRATSPSIASDHDFVPEDSGRSPALRIRCRDFHMMAFHFHAPSRSQTSDELAREVFFILRKRCCVDRIEDLYAFHFEPPPQEKQAEALHYDARREFARMGIGGKASEGPGNAWRLSDINHDYGYSSTYPSVLCVPRAVSDNMLKYGGIFRSRARIPALAYLHFNGGSITRSAQPMVGVQGKRNPQDERLVSAIFSSHTPPLTPLEGSLPQLPALASASFSTIESGGPDSSALESTSPLAGQPQSQSETALDEKATENSGPVKRKVYGSTRRNFIVDARPKLNALANRATGGGIEDVSNYLGGGDVPVERIFLNIQNIHVMRSSLEKVIESFANSDYLELRPDQDMLRKSAWLGHIANVLDGAGLVARAVGLTGSHVLVHCSDGWDRTAQVSALAQMMLDPHYRTLDGFITLVQKDFLSFGHKFRDRNGIRGYEKWFEIENERIAPSKQRENGGSEPASLNALGSKALSGAKSWFDKNRTSLFRQQNASQESLPSAASRPASPPPNPVIHSPPTKDGREDKEHKVEEKEIAPIFHQFLEAVWQVQRQYPNAFEFNERFLLRLLYHTYACQYGEYLFNCEKERVECDKKRIQQGKKPLPSVWMHFLARRAEFLNSSYSAAEYDSLLLPKRGADQQVDVRWWARLFGREDQEMNVLRALAPTDSHVMRSETSSVSFEEDGVAGTVKREQEATNGSATLREAKSTPEFRGKKEETLALGFSDLNLQDNAGSLTSTVKRPHVVSLDDDSEVLAKHASPDVSMPAQPALAQTETVFVQTEDGGDPLGVSASSAKKQSSGGLDFAAFASQNAYSDK